VASTFKLKRYDFIIPVHFPILHCKQDENDTFSQPASPFFSFGGTAAPSTNAFA
jgi:hypothetical protein